MLTELLLTTVLTGLINFNSLTEATVTYRDVGILGGKAAKSNQFPYVVSIRFLGSVRTDLNKHHCGGTIYNKDYIITAAHCMVYLQNPILPYALTVVAGSIDVLKSSDSEQVRNVAAVIIHKDYNGSNFANDIAMVKLETPLDLSKLSISPLPLAEEGHVSSGVATVIGWGMLSNTAIYPHILQYVNDKIISQETCSKLNTYPDITESMMCTFTEGLGSCHGDSGGPLVCKDTDEKYLCGIVSWGGSLCGEFAAVYTKVASYVDWILENTKSTD